MSGLAHDGRSGFPWRTLAWGGSGAILLAPLLAMHINPGVNWTLGDFAVMGVMLGAACLGLEIMLRAGGSFSYRLGSAAALGAAFLLTWINLAVGIIADEAQSANLLYGAVLLTALVGSFASRLEARGLARAMLATAMVQLMVPVAVLLIWPDAAPLAYQPEVPILTAVFTAAWLASAWLFRRSAT